MSDWRMKCNRCGTSEAELRRCTRCFTVYYCSKDCQLLDWASHKKLCIIKTDKGPSGDFTIRNVTTETSMDTETMADLRMKCSRCGTSEAELRRCTRCFRVYYCSKDCQRLDWASHKKQCVMNLVTEPSDDIICNLTKKTSMYTETMSDLRMKCNQCGISEVDLRRCAMCFAVYYCSKDCQRLNWASHKKQCVVKTHLQSPGGGIALNATKATSENKQDTEKRAGQNQNTDDVETVGSSPLLKKNVNTAFTENADRNPTFDGRHSVATLHDGRGDFQNTEVNAESVSTACASGTSVRETKFPFRMEKGICNSKHCFKKLFCTMTCSKCKVAFYCSKKCQKADWPAHKKHCKKVSDEEVPKKSTPLTDDEAYIVDSMKRRQQRFREGNCRTSEKTYPLDTLEFTVQNYTGPYDRLFAPTVTPDMLKIHERPSGSLHKALRYARVCFPGWTLIDDFQDIPNEISRMAIFLQELQKHSMRNVLVAFMFMYHDHRMRHGIFLKDAADKITHVEFYFDHLNDDPMPHFTYADVTPGNYILLQNPLIHQFSDGQVGIRINNPAEVIVYKTDE